MELTERSVSVLLDYLYTGQIYLPPDLQFLLEVARAADCFQLENVLSWLHGIILANVSDVVRVGRGYDKMTERDLIFNLQAKQVTDWGDLRDSECYLVLAGGSEAGGLSLYDPSVDLWSPLALELGGWAPCRAALHRDSLYLLGKRSVDK